MELFRLELAVLVPAGWMVSEAGKRTDRSANGIILLLVLAIAVLVVWRVYFYLRPPDKP
jgi:hypothetical protein